MNTHHLPALLTAPRAASLLGLPPRTLARLTACHAVPSVKINRSRRYPLQALEMWLASGCPTEPGSGNALLAQWRKAVAR